MLYLGTDYSVQVHPIITGFKKKIKKNATFFYLRDLPSFGSAGLNDQQLGVNTHKTFYVIFHEFLKPLYDIRIFTCVRIHKSIHEKLI